MGGPKPGSSLQLSAPAVSLLHCSESASAAVTQGGCTESGRGRQGCLKHTGCGSVGA